MQTTRRDLIKGLAALPVLPVVAAAASPVATQGGQPMPARTIHSTLDGFTAITRLWNGNDHRRCRRCPRCDAYDLAGGGGACLVLTDVSVGLADAPTFDCKDHDYA